MNCMIERSGLVWDVMIIFKIRNSYTIPSYIVTVENKGVLRDCLFL